MSSLPARVPATPVRHEPENQGLREPSPTIALGLKILALSVQILLAGGAVLMGAWAGMPWPGCAGVGAPGVAAAVAAAGFPGWRDRGRGWALTVAWAGTVAVLASAMMARGATATLGTYLDAYYVALSWMVAMSILPACGTKPGARLAEESPPRATSNAAEPSPSFIQKGRGVPPCSLSRGLGCKRCWRLLAVFWFMLGGLSWLGASYAQNRPGSFYIGLLILLALLVLCHFWIRLNAAGIVAANTLILLILGLPVLDQVLRRAGSLGADLDPHKQVYLYAAAKRDPAAFGRWWNYYLAQFRHAQEQIYMPDPDPLLGPRLRPNSRARLVQSPISINSLGFRGPEIPAAKGDAYRIVALGESTTFGITLDEDHHPWPELLEQMIRQRLKLRRPVQVINAGIPGYRLDQNLHRLPRDILPLRPDIVISYHGINAFHLLRDAVPFSPGIRAPAYRDRPIRLLADVEYRLKLIRFHRLDRWNRIPRPATPADPLATPYAGFYRELIETSQANGIRLLLANYSLAVNDPGRRDLIEFYQAGYPAARWQIEANRVHSDIVQKLAGQHPEVCLVDTHPGLDGEHDNYIDFVHFAPAGDRQMAETFFKALLPILESELVAR